MCLGHLPVKEASGRSTPGGKKVKLDAHLRFHFEFYVKHKSISGENEMKTEPVHVCASTLYFSRPMKGINITPTNKKPQNGRALARPFSFYLKLQCSFDDV